MLSCWQFTLPLIYSRGCTPFWVRAGCYNIASIRALSPSSYDRRTNANWGHSWDSRTCVLSNSAKCLVTKKVVLDPCLWLVLTQPAWKFYGIEIVRRTTTYVAGMGAVCQRGTLVHVRVYSRPQNPADSSVTVYPLFLPISAIWSTHRMVRGRLDSPGDTRNFLPAQILWSFWSHRQSSRFRERRDLGTSTSGHVCLGAPCPVDWKSRRRWRPRFCWPLHVFSRVKITNSGPNLTGKV